MSKKEQTILDEAAEEWVFRNIHDCDVVGEHRCEESFIAGANWQKEQDLAEMAQSKSSLSVAYANRCFENGKQAMKEQMLKDAEETELYWDGDFLAIDLNMAALGYSERDKVRIVILKEEC